MGSSRFPGKPMAYINGIPMIGHVWHRCKMSKKLEEVYIATCDREIFDYIQSIGGKALMTKASHERCTERTEEALDIIIQQTKQTPDIVVMIQGDEPMTTPEMIDDAISPMLRNSSINVVNLMATITNRKDMEDPNEIKVVVDKHMNALYFSREPIPSNKKFSGEITAYKQICIIPFRAAYLKQFMQMPPTLLEKIESIDMMRILENGDKVKMVMTQAVSYSVDTTEDLIRVEKIMKIDKTTAMYSKLIPTNH